MDRRWDAAALRGFAIACGRAAGLEPDKAEAVAEAVVLHPAIPPRLAARLGVPLPPAQTQSGSGS